MNALVEKWAKETNSQFINAEMQILTKICSYFHLEIKIHVYLWRLK